MSCGSSLVQVKNHWERVGLGQRILDELSAAGKNVNSLTIDDLAPYDHFHGGGKEMTLRLAQAAELQAGMRVLDVGGGLGGPARTLAVEFGCHVTVADLSESYQQAGRILTERLELGRQVAFVNADALNLPFEAESFDLVWTQNSGMNIEDKAGLYSGIHRVLRPGGKLVFQEPMAGKEGQPLFPLMWATDATTNFIRTPAEMKTIIENAGFSLQAWEDVTPELTKFRARSEFPVHNIQYLVMGENLHEILEVSNRNIEEGRIVLVQALFHSKAS